MWSRTLIIVAARTECPKKNTKIRTGIQQHSWNDTFVPSQQLLMKGKVLKQSQQLGKLAGVGIQVSNMMWCHST